MQGKKIMLAKSTHFSTCKALSNSTVLEIVNKLSTMALGVQKVLKNRFTGNLIAKQESQRWIKGELVKV